MVGQFGPVFARNVLGPAHRPAVDPDRRHAKRVRGLKNIRQIVENGGLLADDSMGGDEPVEPFTRGLRVQIFERVNIEDIFKTVEHAEFCRDAFGVLAAAIGKHQLSARQRVDRGAELRRWRDHVEIDVVDVIEKVVWPDAMLADEAG